MTVLCCDLCKKQMCNYTDNRGSYWEGISFQSKKYRRRFSSMFDTWTEYLSICGRCRAEIANLSSATTIDPVKHGKWVRNNPLTDTLACSECNYEIPTEELQTPYCPWCGSSMDMNDIGEGGLHDDKD